MLATKEFWGRYWRDHGAALPARLPMEDLLRSLYGDMPRGSRFIEVGGFPGHYAAFFAREYGFDVSLLDYHADRGVLAGVERESGVPAGTIQVVERDLFAGAPDLAGRFDFVFSSGFLEHFETDTAADVLRRHVDLARPGGRLFVGMPNFRGFNGLTQRLLDPETFAVHNLEIMSPRVLRRIAASLDLVDVRVFFHGLPILWLEPSAPVAPRTRRWVDFGSRVMCRFRIPSRLLSPYVVLVARRAPASA